MARQSVVYTEGAEQAVAKGARLNPAANGPSQVEGNQEDIDLVAVLVVIGSVAALTIMSAEAVQGWQLPGELLTSSDSLSWWFRYFCPDMPAQRVDDLCR